jgi:hypothetical protein
MTSRRIFGALLFVALVPGIARPAPAEPARPKLQEILGRAASTALSRQPVRNFRSPDNETCSPHLMLCGQVVESTLTTEDCAAPPVFADLWFFPNYSRQAVGVGVLTEDFDVLAGLFDPQENVLAADAAPAGSVASFGAFLQSAGNFEILVSSQTTSASKTGSYRLALLCGGDRCVPDVATMCLGRKRYRVQVAWHNQFSGEYGFGRAIARTDSGGFFSFGDPSNVELLVKLLDFGGGTVKVFIGELTNLEFAVAVTDMSDPLQYTKTYTNTPGDCGGIDQDFLAGSSRALRSLATAPASAAAAAGGCRPDKSTLCLLNRRFALTMTWHNQFDGTGGVGGAVPVSSLTGAFYFTDKSDLELVAKMIDFGDRIAVFYGALSDLEYDLTVRDTRTGVAKTYHNPPGQFCGGLDNTAFH